MSFISTFNYNRDRLVEDFSRNPDHGYSLFNLNGDPNQYVIDVVDVGTNTTGSYTAAHLEDGTLLSAVGETGIVSKIYDQFGGKHASAYLNNTGVMPYIITGGEFVTLDDLPAMIFRSGDRNAYLNIKTAGFTNAEPVDLSTHILGVDGIEAFATVSLDENAYSSQPYNNSYIFGENYDSAKKDYALGFYFSSTRNENRLTLYTERGTNNTFTRGSIAGDTDDTQHGYAYTGEIVTTREMYIINSFSKFDEDIGSGIVGFGTGQNYTSGYVVTGRDNYIVGSIGSDQSYDNTFKGRFQEVLFYTSLRDDRDVIYSDIQKRRLNGLNGLISKTISPIYGSSISFESDVSYWRGDNFNSYLMARGLNNIKATMDFTFQGDKDSMKSLIHRLEEATTGAVTGDQAFSGEFNSIHFGESKNGIAINLDTDYYQNFSGSQVSNYSLKPISTNIYEVSLNLFNNRLSPILNNGMAFVSDKTKSIGDGNFEKFDIATGSTGNCNSNIFDNFFYLTEDRSSSINPSNVSGISTYTGVADDATRTFFWEPDQPVSFSVDHQSRINQFKKSFHQSLNISKNQNRLNEVQLVFSNRTMEETYSMLHFFESHLGYKNFVYYIGDDIINPNRVFFCPRWKHTFNYKNSNTIEATFVEIVVPVEPKF